MKNRQAWQVLGFAVLLGSTGRTQATQRVSVTPAGVEGNDYSNGASISADGRTVAFLSYATNLASGDTNGVGDAYCRAWVDNENEIVSVDSSSTIGNAASRAPLISADGNFVAFASLATNLVPGDANGIEDVFVRSRVLGTTELVSISSSGVQGNATSFYPSISADGRYVAFMSDATNLVPSDSNGVRDIFVRDRLNGVTQRLSISSAGAQSNGDSHYPSISADGRYVAFQSSATNLVPGDTNAVSDIFLHDRQVGVTLRISVSSGGVQGNLHSEFASISADGLSVAFLSSATNLIGSDTNGFSDVYCRAWQSNTTEIVSVSSTSALGNNHCSWPSISADGRFVAFNSWSSNLVPGDTNGASDVFVRNRSIGTTERVSVSSSGVQGDAGSHFPSISADGRYVAYLSNATNLVPGDTNAIGDVFVHDRNASGFTSLCRPGLDGVIACPCSNPPIEVGRGCNNSSGTGGAMLTAGGVAYLSSDTLILTTYGEKPTALSIVLQGNSLASTGLVYGQGVRCAGGTLRRLFIKNAAAGCIVAPDFGAGDPTVSARSAAKGDTIQPGQSRWYLVYYRDTIVLGGCPAGSTFNATQTGEVTWMP